MSLRGIGKTSLVAAIAVLASLPAGASGSAPAAPKIVANHFHNPRSLSLSPSGLLYIADAGKAGTRCVNVPGRGQTCAGSTGALMRFNPATHARERLVKGLPSFGNSDGTFATGLDGVSVAPDASVFGVETSVPPFMAQLLPRTERKLVGQVLRFPGSSARPAGKVAAYETSNDPDGQGLASGPYAISASSMTTQLVADAGGNDVLQVTGGGVSLFNVLPNVGAAPAVPTAITEGPGGTIYVGESVGGAGGAAQVVQILPGGISHTYATGFTHISGLDVGPAGVLYVTELTTSTLDPGSHGAIVEVLPSGLARCTVPGSDQLSFPAGGVVTSDGKTLYVGNYSVLPGETPTSGRFGGANGQIAMLPAAPLCK
jgi:hypothetical protein